LSSLQSYRGQINIWEKICRYGMLAIISMGIILFRKRRRMVN